MSLFAVRLRGHYLAIASLGFAVITYEILMNWISLTQGPLGIYGISPPPPLNLPGLPAIKFSSLPNLFYLIKWLRIVGLYSARSVAPFADRGNTDSHSGG